MGTQEFDSLGRLTKQLSGGRVTRFAYQGASPAPSVVTLPSGKTLQYSYIPELGNVVSSMTAEGVSKVFTYDRKPQTCSTPGKGKQQIQMCGPHRAP
jgi:hypothetical protein